MSVEDRVRAATRARAALVRDVRPLDLSAVPGCAPRARRRVGWAAPMAAAVAVVIVVVGGVAAGSWLERSGNGRSGNPAAVKQGAPAGSFAGVPAYYVAVENPSLAVVRATATGATLARITTRIPFAGVTGAADDRTFVLDAQRQVMGPTVRWPGQPQFYLLRLSAAGAEESFTRFAIPALPDGTAVTGLALSPDGSKLAVEADSGNNGQPGLLEIRVYTLATGAFRGWSAHGSDDPVDPGGFTGSGVDGSQTISWAADSRTLAFDWGNQSYIGVRLLDTTASGDNLIADSRLAVIQADFTSRGGGLSGPPSMSKDNISQCVTDGIISSDGSAIVCGYTTNIQGRQTTTGFIRYSTTTGKPTAVLGVYQFQGQAPGDISLYWVNSTGKTLIGGILTPSGIRVGVISSQRFTPLPGTAGLATAAW
ncbi:MAG TPA: hypothetical protein VIY52_14015 [Streptosporangiaceae bacterium]